MLLQLDFELLKLDKIVIELRHKDVFSLPESRYKILEKLTPRFPAYSTDVPDQLSLVNVENQQTLNFTLNRGLLEWTVPASYNDFTKLCEETLNETYKTILKLDVFTRVGIRSFWGYEVESDKAAFDYVSNRFFSQQAKNIDGFADEIYNPGIRFSGRKETMFFNLASSHQSEQTLEGPLTKMEVVSKKEKVVFDLDLYRENCNLRNLPTFYENTNKFVKTNFKNYLKNIEG